MNLFIFLGISSQFLKPGTLVVWQVAAASYTGGSCAAGTALPCLGAAAAPWGPGCAGASPLPGCWPQKQALKHLLGNTAEDGSV